MKNQKNKLKSCGELKLYLFLQKIIEMRFVQSIQGYDHLWAVKKPDSEFDELTSLFEKWNDMLYLMDFFKEHIEELNDYFHISKVADAISDTMDDAEELERLILDFPYTENLDSLFKPLSPSDDRTRELNREKVRNWDRPQHASWLRIYAIRLESNVYVVTGGAIKLTATMQDAPHTQLELDKLNACKAYLQANGVFDKDSFIDLTNED